MGVSNLWLYAQVNRIQLPQLITGSFKLYFLHVMCCDEGKGRNIGVRHADQWVSPENAIDKKWKKVTQGKLYSSFTLKGISIQLGHGKYTSLVNLY